MNKLTLFLLSALTGGVVGTVFVTVSGILALQHEGRQNGVVFSVFSDNTPRITNPESSILSVASMAALGALVIWALLVGFEPGRTARIIGFLLSSVVWIAWGLALGPNLGIIHDLNVGDGVSWGMPGWVKYGSTEPMVYLVMFLALGALVMRASAFRADKSGENDATTEPLPV